MLKPLFFLTVCLTFLFTFVPAYGDDVTTSDNSVSSSNNNNNDDDNNDQEPALVILSPQRQTNRRELIRNRMKWKTFGSDNYRMVFSHSCFCTVCYTAPVEIVVRNRQIVSVTYVPDNLPPECVGKEAEVENWPTITDLFKVIDTGLTEKYHSLTVKYHKRLGYPMAIDTDPDAMIIDEEMYYRVTSLTLE